MKRPLIDLINIVGAFIVVCIISFAVYTLFVGKPFYKFNSYSFGWNESDKSVVSGGDDSGTYTTDKAASVVEVSNVSGLIEIEGWNKDYVQLDYVKRGPGRHPEVTVDQSGSTVLIKAVYPKAPGNFGSVDFYLKVPESLRSVDARSVSGRISVEGLEPGVNQRLSSTSGAVRTDGSGDINISSVSGQLSFVSSGNIVHASTTSGRIDGKLENIPAKGRIDISSVSGRIVLDVPSNLNADVNFHSVSGSVSSDLPVSVTETKRNTIKGMIGSGGTSMEVSTVSGSIKITE